MLTSEFKAIDLNDNTRAFKRKIGVMGMVLKKILLVVSQDQSPGKRNL